MKKFKITWQNKKNLLPFKRINTFLTTHKEAAIALCHREFGSDKKIEILSVEEVTEEDDKNET